MAKILVVDDDSVFCDLFMERLQRYGHTVLTVRNGRDALDVFVRDRPEFTLLDIRMPVMNGLEVLKKMHEIDPQAVVMMQTAWGASAYYQDARQYGSRDFLSKEVTLASLVRSIEQGRSLEPHDDLSLRLLLAKEDAGKDLRLTGMRLTASILLVDDQPEQRDRLKTLLMLHGCTVHVAEDGSSAGEMVLRTKPQVIVLSGDMVTMTGVEALRLLQRWQFYGGVVLLTDHPDTQLLQESSERRSVHILGAPFESERLVMAIQLSI